MFRKIFGKYCPAFFESSDRRNPTKDVFSIERAKRIDWIRFALESDSAEIFETLRESLTLVAGKYLVVIQLDERVAKRARFITAYIHDHPDRVRRGPRNKRIWPKKNDRWLRPSGPSLCRFQAVSRGHRYYNLDRRKYSSSARVFCL